MIKILIAVILVIIMFLVNKMCMKKNLEMNANAFCGWYECKIDLQ